MSKYTWILILGLSAVLAVFLVIGNHSFYKVLAINEELADMEAKNHALESEIVELKNKIYAVQNHDPTLEKKAREELGLAKKGEVVYIFPENEQSQRQAR